MNRRTLERFRKWFVNNAPDGLDFEDPVALLDRIRATDRNRVSQSNRRYGPDDEAGASEVKKFLWSLVCKFEVTHISPEELGPVLVEAAAAVTLRS